jgi:hypothetical protein
MNVKRRERKRSCPNLASIHVDGPRKNTKNLRQDSRFPSRDLNPGPPEYEARVLNTRPRLSATQKKSHFIAKHIKTMTFIAYSSVSHRA